MPVAPTNHELYTAASIAILALLQGAQSYTVGDYTYTLVDLDKLRRFRDALAAEIEREQAGMSRGPTFYTASGRRR